MTMFDLNCTLPSSGVVFVGPPNARGTLDILWGCVSVILLCAWSVLHLNVPEQSTPRNAKDKFKRDSIRLLWSVFWMTVNILAPEWALGKAWADRCAVRKADLLFNEYKEKDGVEWTTRHTFLANMGGITVSFVDLAPSYHPTENFNAGDPVKVNLEHSTELPAPRTSITTASSTLKSPRGYSEPKPWKKMLSTETLHNELPKIDNQISEKIKKRFQAEENRFLVNRSASRLTAGFLHWGEDYINAENVTRAVQDLQLDDFTTPEERALFNRHPTMWWNNLQALRGDSWVLDALQLFLARQMGIIDKLPDLTEDNINDRSKSGFFIKLVALLQTLWFIIQLIARQRQQLPTSQLEIVTLAFAVCSGVTYFLLSNKPKDVQCSVQIPAARYAEATEMSRLAIYGPQMIGPGRSSYWQALWIPNNSMHLGDFKGRGLGSLGAGTAVSLFVSGLVYCIAWDSAFPTFYETVMWRISTIVTATALPVGYCLVWTNRLFWRSTLGQRLFVETHMKYSIGFDNWISLILGSVGFCARLFTIVEALRSLSFLPPEAFYTVNWTEAIPHFS